MTMRFTVRPASQEDVGLIAVWTRDTFSWGDYVAESIGDWIDSTEIHVMVVVDAIDVPIAVAKVEMLSPQEGWLSSARVHPDWRRQGLGTLLNHASVDYIRSQGGLVARLAVEEDNTAARAQAAKLGYQPTCTWIYGSTSSNPSMRLDPADTLNAVGRSDVDPAWMYWSTSDIAEAGRALIPKKWQWRRAVVADLEKAAKERRLFANAVGWVVVEYVVDGEIDVVWVASSQGDFPRLVNGIRHMARGDGIKEVIFRIPQTGWSGETLIREGADISEILIFSKAVI